MQQSAAHLAASATAPPATAAAAPAPPDAAQPLRGEVSAAAVLAAVHQPPLQIAIGASAAVRDGITASVALDPDLSIAGAAETLPSARPAALISELKLPSRPGGPQASIPETATAAPSDPDVRVSIHPAGGPGQPQGVEGVQLEVEAVTAASAASVGGVEGGVMKKLADAWAALGDVFPDAFLLEGTPVAFIDSPSCTQVWIHSNERLKQVRACPRHTPSVRGLERFCN